MPKAIWNGQVIAESDETIMVEGNHYFPREAINSEFFSESQSHTMCPWKGIASYYDVVVEGEKNQNAAWFYPDPSHAAQPIKDHVAFWHGVQVIP